MIDTQVQGVLDLLNSQLHSRVDYALFSQIFDAVANIDVPQGYKLVPLEPTHEMWSGLSRHLGRYMQSHDRYCPKTLKKYLDRFIGEPPEWLTKEVKDWDSEHAFATADLPVFIYKAMIGACDN